MPKNLFRHPADIPDVEADPMDPFYIVLVIVLVLGILGGYYLYRNALRAGREMDAGDDNEGTEEGT